MATTRRTSPNRATPGRPAAATTMVPPLREEIGDALERLSRMLVQRVPGPLPTDAAGNAGAADTGHIQETVRFLGQIASGWQYLSEDAWPEDAAGFGSTVNVEDVQSGSRETYTLMTGALLDIDAGQVSLASPIGQALLGCKPGRVVTVDTPQRRRTLRVLSVRTLRDRLDGLQLESAAA